MQAAHRRNRIVGLPRLALLLLGFAAAAASLGGGVAAAPLSDTADCKRLAQSTKRPGEACGEEPGGGMMTWPLLITGAGRSGTLFTASLLNRVGLRLSHDNRFDPMRGTKRDAAGPLRDGAVSWVYAFHDDAYPK